MDDNNGVQIESEGEVEEEPEESPTRPSDISYLSNFDQMSTSKSSLTGFTKLFVLLTNFTVMVFPLISYTYSWSLYEKPARSVRLSRQEL
mmetsp:Transcript_13152/g.20449  ORF Transcript_13152/g.20449 Transcript_13152/m.20449 type:complete len:90 (+) Transcript_13152:860-1129(+)